MSASNLQSVSEAGFPKSGTPRQKMAFALRYAMLAPTEIDWQPWDFRLTDAHIELMAWSASGREAMEPEGRESMISCGAALVYLKLALRHFGCLGRVTLFPDLDQPDLAARISFGSGRERDEHDQMLFEAMMRRSSDEPLMQEVPIPSTALAALNRAVARERGWVEFARSETSRQRLIEVAYSPGTRPSLNPFGDRSSMPSGFPEFAESSPVSFAERVTGTFLGSRIRRKEPVLDAVQPEEPPPLPGATLAVVKTKTDDKRGWLAAGHAMARVILQTQALGLSWSFFNHPVRCRYARQALRTGMGHKGFAQVILRLCSGSGVEEYPPAPAATRAAVFQW